MAVVVHPGPRPAGIVVGIGDQGIEAYRAAVRLGAEEAGLRHVPLRLVHGSRPDGRAGDPALAGMESRQQRGRRLVNGAARGLAGTTLGRQLQISTESSPQTGVDLLIAHGRTAVMLVLQHGGGWNLAVGPTTRAVTAGADCPTLVARSSLRSPTGTGVLLVLDLEHDPAPAIALAFTEASLRGVAVTVLDVRSDRAAARSAVQARQSEDAGVAVRFAEIEQAAVQVRDLVADAALLVVTRPARGEHGLVADAVAEARCPVLTVAPVDAGA